MKEKSELIRIVRTPEGEVKIDASGKSNGRGAYLCKDAGCLKRAMKSGVLSRSLKIQVPESLFETLASEIAEDSDDKRRENSRISGSCG